MHYVFESVFVAIYTTTLFIFLHRIKNKLLLLFILGFLKHFLGYVLYIHEYYCNKCANSASTFEPVFIQSIVEGVYFMIIGYIGFSFIRNRIFFIFGLGLCTHLLSEWIGVHTYFCQNNCIPLYRYLSE